ncbi:MAG: hypothetical protein JW801_01285 [Bacteroidales bacterium]|nr:hypothetical protein [Bacteroidales bacterium]
MKKISVLLAFCLLSMLPLSAADLFSYNAEQLQNELLVLNELECAVIQDQLTRAPFEMDLLPAVKGAVQMVPQPNAEVDKLYGIPPFYWGLLLSGVGIAYVYKVSQDSERTKQAFLGCVVNGVALTSIYLIRLLILY